MSDSQAYEEVTAASDGVTVTKRFEEDDFPVPAIAFTIRSDRTEAVTIRLVDAVPEDVAVEDLGFHPEYGSEYWDINDEQIAFEKELEPDSEYVTVYGIRATGTDDIQKFLTEPTLERVDPPLDGEEEAIVGSSDNAVKDVISGDSDSIPGLEDEESAPEGDDIETLDLKDPNSEGSPDESETGGDDGESPEVEIANGNVIGAMAAEIRQNNVSADDVKMLKRALDAVSADDTSGADTARIQRIQADVADLRAYTDALEEFLDENGTGDEMIQEFRERLDAFESDLDRFESDIHGAKSTAEAASSEVETVSEDVSEVHDELDGIEESLDDMNRWLESLEDDVDEVRDELGDGDIEDRLASVEQSIEELNDWREQLSSVIGGGQ